MFNVSLMVVVALLVDYLFSNDIRIGLLIVIMLNHKKTTNVP